MILSKGKMESDLHFRAIALAVGAAGGLNGKPEEEREFGRPCNSLCER